MKQKRLKLIAILLLSFELIGVQAQETVSATGGEASGGGGTTNYSVAQVIYTTNTGVNGSVAQGVQQPYEISVVTGTEQTRGIILELSAYPNPTTDYLTLKIKNYDKKNLSYQLFDINGKLIESRKLANNETKIKMKNFMPANYFLKIMDNQKEVKTFKIIKN